MNNVYVLPTQKRCYDEASEWLARLDRDLGADEEAALRTWLEHAENRNALLRLAALWDRMDRLSLLAALFPKAKVLKRRRFMYPAMAAGLALLAASFAFINLRPSGADRADAQRQAAAASVYETAVGEHSTVRLPDQSLLVLNTNSLLKVFYSHQQRLFILERGEMNIEVAHDKARPLRVMAGRKVVQAVGTAFNVQILDDDQIELIVTEGQVLVADRGVDDPPSAPVPRPLGASQAVSQGERILLGAPAATISRISEADTSAQLSWRQGKLVFSGETLAEAIHELSRYTQVRFELADEKLNDIRVGGVFQVGDVDGLLATLKQNFNIDYERLDAQTVLLKAR